MELSAGYSTMEVDLGLGKGKHGLFTFKFLESEEGRGATYEGVIRLIDCLRDRLMPRAIGMRKASLLWVRDGQPEEELSVPSPSGCLLM